eukprot:6207237-Pleurochrysis_carterae.AAC.3
MIEYAPLKVGVHIPYVGGYDTCMDHHHLLTQRTRSACMHLVADAQLDNVGGHQLLGRHLVRPDAAT